MPIKQLKHARCRVDEYQVRQIDEYGDAIDVDGFETKAEAVEAAEKAVKVWGAVASVVEFVRKWYPAHGQPDSYKLIATFGSEAALREGNWLETENEQ